MKRVSKPSHPQILGGFIKYRKKPVVIEAFRWTGDETQEEYPIWMVEALKNDTAWMCVDPFSRSDTVTHMAIKTLEGTMEARFGDWIIQGIKGELYPCKDDIFQATYERVEE